MGNLIDKIKEKEQERQKEFSVLFWKPEPGQIVEGVVEEIGNTITEHGDAEYVQIATDEGKKFMVFLNSVLHKLMEAEEVKVGDRIAIKYAGLVESKKSKRKFKDFILVKEGSSDSQDAKH